MEFRTIQVNTPAVSTALTTISVVKRSLEITVSTYDTFLQEAIARASAAIASYTDRVWGQETVTERIWLGSCRPIINLRRYPNISISSLTEDGTALTVNDGYLIDDEQGKLVRLCGGRPAEWRRCAWIEIAYQAGYALMDGLPYDVEDACIRLVKMAYAAKGRDPLLKVDDVEGIGRQEYWVGSTSGSDLPDEVRALLRCYVNPVV